LDSYPTYHDGRGTSHLGSGTKPTDAALPRGRRTFGTPMMIGLIAFALVIVAYLVMGGMELTRTTDQALTPGDGATPTQSATTGASDNMGTDVPENDNAQDSDGQAQPATGPGTVEAAPGGIDVPGGSTTTPVTPAPAQ
jgi:hypothetical protein